MAIAFVDIVSNLELLLQEAVLEDDKSGTAQHVVPAALLKNFSTPINFQVKAVDYYNLPPSDCSGCSDSADRYMTHVESHSYAAVDQLLRSTLTDEPGQQLEDLVCTSSRRKVRAKHTAMFYLYLATLVLRSPLARDKMPWIESYVQQGLASHSNFKLIKTNPLLRDAVKQFAYLSPFVIRLLAIALAKKSVTIYISNKQFLPGPTLAGPLPEGSRFKAAAFKDDYLAVLGDSVAVMLESPHVAGAAFKVKKADYTRVAAINDQINQWSKSLVSPT